MLDKLRSCHKSKLLEASEKIKAAAISSEKTKQGAIECDKQVEKLHSEVTALSKKAHQTETEKNNLKIEGDKAAEGLTQCNNKIVTLKQKITQLQESVQACEGSDEQALLAQNSVKEAETLLADSERKLAQQKQLTDKLS